MAEIGAGERVGGRDEVSSIHYPEFKSETKHTSALHNTSSGRIDFIRYLLRCSNKRGKLPLQGEQEVVATVARILHARQDQVEEGLLPSTHSIHSRCAWSG